jgi:penicillin amidase
MFVIVLSRQVFKTPPLGPALNPFTGIVQNERDTYGDKEFDLSTNQEVDVLFDERGVPHIFAQNQSDVFFAQGYVCATDRLWQMDFISYAAAGRLSEIFGASLLDYDRIQRRDGMLHSAINSLAYIEKDVETKAILDKYTAGVNAMITKLTFSDQPVEYKLLGYAPEPWTNLKTVLVMKYVSASLSGYEEDVSASYMQMILGTEEYDKLFVDYYLSNQGKGFGINRILDSLPKNEYIDYTFLEANKPTESSRFNPRLGSNSWAIGPNKSKSGAAILCNDPHLNLSLPAIWYENQLCWDKENVYGYSIPGVPGIIIGFNEKIAWGLTNGSADVRDYYKLELNADYSKYKYDNKWVETEMIIEEIKVRSGESFLDTVYYSNHGPIFSDYRFGIPESRGCAVDWTLHESSNEFLTFIKLNKAKNYSDFQKAIKYYSCPVQNFSYDDIKGNIGVNFQGKVRKKAWHNQGKFIMDGTRSDQFSKSYIDRLPSVFNPSQGYVFSANNNPFRELDSILIYGHYAELRADKIDAILAGKEKVTINDMKAMQLDNTNRLAELAIPILLKAMPDSNDDRLRKFSKWDCNYGADSELGLIFENWWQNIKENTWDELTRYSKSNSLPQDLVLLDLISNDPKSPYFDILSTSKVESAADIIALSFRKAWEDRNNHKKWGSHNKVDFLHLSNIPGLSELGIELWGHPHALNAISKNWGPTLRLVVEMKGRPRGYGIYAGGQSGNPASKKYKKGINDWSKGFYYKLHFFSDTKEGESHMKYKWTLH